MGRGRLRMVSIVVAQATGLMTVAINAVPETASDSLIGLRAQVSAVQAAARWSCKLRRIRCKEARSRYGGADRGTLPLMREIKRRFDPNRILNPGRFVGNI